MHSTRITFSNPILKDRIEVLQHTSEKLIFRTYLEPGGGQTDLHYHTQIEEKFTVIRGTLSLYLGTEETLLTTKQSAIALPFCSHRFFNNSNEVVIFDVEILQPKQTLCALKILYGIAEHGKITRDGLPKNKLHLAIALKMMDAYSPKIPQQLQHTAILLLAGFGKFLGVQKKLVTMYCSS
ncbi:Mannose-6-phosphate isomerase, cupin superfamily [Pustulibacterium marinum]|uniref:Mannose-6-phosphate isomerase, cupin superfamily n=1 Tax=Pustulibacterium marinum TaxID=1224947 RepID=A0A1I7H471_9FLAO|nr:cupin domain-containing protein [Pustulibacterium marinum]SFU55509.1 Mannose-6-phosphate isomerase, cupin superfamily [Pustulibacterium marinum]